MTFEEMQIMMQSIAVSHVAAQAEISDMRTVQRDIQASQREMQISQQKSQDDLQQFKQEVQRIVQSNDRTIQSILDQATTDRLKQEEQRTYHEARMERLERISEALTNMLVSVDEDRPTILRKLNSIEQKSIDILERLRSE